MNGYPLEPERGRFYPLHGEHLTAVTVIQRLFNTSPAPGALVLLDRSKRRYWLVLPDDTEPDHLTVVRRGRCAGIVKLIWDVPTLQVADIQVFERHRSHGVGTLVLREVIELARRSGIETIEGFVVRRDLRKSHGLLEWYRKQGFEVTPVLDEWKAATLLLDLRTRTAHSQIGEVAREGGGACHGRGRRGGVQALAPGP